MTAIQSLRWKAGPGLVVVLFFPVRERVGRSKLKLVPKDPKIGDHGNLMHDWTF